MLVRASLCVCVCVCGCSRVCEWCLWIKVYVRVNQHAYVFVVHSWVYAFACMRVHVPVCVRVGVDFLCRACS